MRLETPALAEPLTVWRTDWLRVTLACAVLTTSLDAVLLEGKKGFFSGGFLAMDHVRTPVEGTAFLLVSLLVDAAVVGVLVAIGLRLFQGVRLTRAARLTASASIALGPLLISNFVSLELRTYLGDAFDLGLMFELTGRRPEEFLAVASSHLVGPFALLTTGGLCAFGVVWALNRFAPGSAGRVRTHPGPRVWRWTSGVFLAGLCASAVLRAGSDVIDNGLRRKPAGKILGFVAERISDVDGDGFGAIARVADAAPFDAAVFPYAVDIPGNGIDEDGIAGDLTAAETRPSQTADVASGWRSTPDVVLIVLESFRADATGARLAGRAVTPALDELASRGIAAQLAFSHNGYTAQSRYHLFSGALAASPAATSLIDDFKANGYEVAYFSGQDESFGGPGFSVGFDRADTAYDARSEPERRYSTFSTAGSLAVPLTVVRDRVEAFLSSRESTRPLLLYVNFHDTHFPYHHSGIEPIVSGAAIERRRIGPTRREELRETYLNTAANVDRAIASILTSARRSLRAEPAVIVTSDHGESLYEEGFLGHGYALNDVQTRIPLIVQGLPLQITEPFGQVELREAIRATLSAPAASGPPLVRRDHTKRVFQYLGTVRRPRAIAFTTTAGRTVYDFARRELQMRGGQWRTPSNLAPSEREEFVGLVQFWEQLVLEDDRSVTRSHAAPLGGER